MVCLTACLDQQHPVPALSRESRPSGCQDNGSRSRSKRMQQSSIGAAAGARQPTSGNKYTPFPSRSPADVVALAVGNGLSGARRAASPVPPLPPLSAGDGTRLPRTQAIPSTPRPLQGVVSSPLETDSGFDRCLPLFTSPPSSLPNSCTSAVCDSSSSSSSSNNDAAADSLPASGARPDSSCTLVALPARSRPTTTTATTITTLQPPANDDASTATFSTSTSSEVYLYLYRHLPKVTSDVDYDRLARSMQGLQAGCFYYPDLDSSGARHMLRKAPEGTFLVRDSSDPKYLFSISVKTSRGATSVRIQYYRGFFQLDCEDHMKRKLPRFETLLDLLDFHMTVYKEGQGTQFRWQEGRGASSQTPRTDMVIALTKPRRHSPPSLAHLSRVCVNRSLHDLHLPHRSTDRLPVPDSLKHYLKGYPFKV